jgi:membrane protein implicated in regulation of membrane protease activity
VADLLSSISALTVFLGIAALGLIFLVVSLVFGELLDNFGLHGAGDGGIDGHGFIDTRSLAVFITAFGGFGAIGIQGGLGVVASSLVGLGSGVVLGGAVALFGRFLYSQQASSSVSGAQLVGRTAQVTVAIPPGGVGQISCRVGEERVEKLARSREGDELKTGSRVMIEEFAGDSVIVSPAGNGRQHPPLIQG